MTETLPLARRRTRLDDGLVGVCHGPIEWSTALRALPLQARLRLPVKVVRAQDGRGELVAEIPRVLELPDCRKLAEEALDAALDWLAAGCPAPRPRGGRGASGRAGRSAERDELEEALSALPWPWESDGEGGYRVRAGWRSRAARLSVRPVGTGALRISTGTALQSRAPETNRAAALFALEAGRRVRFARIAVAEAGAALQFEWDAVLPGSLPLARALSPLVEAVLAARSESAPALEALAQSPVARAYLDLRRMDLRTS